MHHYRGFAFDSIFVAALATGVAAFTTCAAMSNVIPCRGRVPDDAIMGVPWTAAGIAALTVGLWFRTKSWLRAGALMSLLIWLGLLGLEWHQLSKAPPSLGVGFARAIIYVAAIATTATYVITYLIAFAILTVARWYKILRQREGFVLSPPPLDLRSQPHADERSLRQRNS